jgi:hypothetical protein
MNYKNETMTEYEKSIMILNELGHINDFKSLFLTDVFYFEHFKGGYTLIKSVLNDKYKEYGDEDELMAEIDELLEQNYIFKTTKKAIFQSKFITNTYLSLNKQIASVEAIKEYVKQFENNEN